MTKTGPEKLPLSSLLSSESGLPQTWAQGFRSIVFFSLVLPNYELLWEIEIQRRNLMGME